ncbi:MAG: glycosyltransferase family 2 protein [Acidobacteria bacterium]|nr:MAG: glycosyltransferase family 2 protein [Acidobacteriota bacterium]
MERISLTAFFPAYNDQHTIEAIVRTAAEEMRKVTDDFEVLVVNDGSKDQTGVILTQLQSKLPFLRVIHHERNRGYGAALISGFKNARKDLIFYTDGDGQYDVREIHNLLAELKPNIELVNGYKVKRADAWYRIWIGALYRRAMKWVFGFSIRDVDCDFRLLRRYIFETISLESASGVICVEMAKKFDRAGFRMVEVPVSHYPRLHGRSEFFRVRHLVHTFRGLLKIWWNLVLSPRLPVWMSTAPRKY